MVTGTTPSGRAAIRLVASLAALVVGATACAPASPPPSLGASDARITAVEHVSGTTAHGLVTNHGTEVLDYVVEVGASDGASASTTVSYVLPGETAMFWVPFRGDVSVSVLSSVARAAVATTPSGHPRHPVTAIAAVTAHEHFNSDTVTMVSGTIRNTGATVEDLVVEVLFTDGQVTFAVAYDVGPMELATWNATTPGNVSVDRILRVTLA